ncbi:xanthine dehydrogenase family protein molybdopterin-binding subunit [Pandoraea pneumonica]|uniref:xanthine dehydrogenase family protein molybdopterin-binding subunit n=1 Tax=Pandoraea pneumonica TaxID=2508299 RepID=UPI003CEFB63A
MGISRRMFIKAAALAPSICIAPLGSEAFASLFDDKIFTPLRWHDDTGAMRFRADGIAKVSGAKVFARDIRAWDMPHWPEHQSYAFLLATTRVDRRFEGLDLSRLADDAQADRIVMAEDLARAGLDFPKHYPYGADMLLPKGSVPEYFGHPVAILIYHDFGRFSLAKSRLQFQKDVIRYGQPAQATSRPPYAAFRFVRQAGQTKDAPDLFSSVQDDYVMPQSFAGDTPVWPVADAHGNAGQRGMHFAERIGASLDQPKGPVRVFSGEFHSPYIDHCALETDNCNAWYDPAKRQLHMVLASQSPHIEATGIDLMAKSGKVPVDKLFLHPAHTVGYGGKECALLPYYGAVAAMFAEGKPVRLAYDRYEQFQLGLKRHPVRTRTRLAVDTQTLRMQTLEANFELNGGGRCLSTPIIALVAAGQATSIYDIPSVDSRAVGLATCAPPVSAMRGVGGAESEPSLEMLVDEVAESLGVDAIELRLKNALQTGQRTITGEVPVVQSRLTEVLERTQAHPLWRDRQATKRAFERANPGLRYGVGVACVQRGFGNLAEAGYAALSLAPDGTITLKHMLVEIGTGASTSQARICAEWLGMPADRIETGVLDWEALGLYEDQNPYLMSADAQTRSAEDPRWTPSLVSNSSATNSAYYFSHYTRQAAKVVFMHGVAVAAARLWGTEVEAARAARWVDARLVLAGHEPLTLARLAASVHEQGLPSGAMVHGFDRWAWAEAGYEVGGTVHRMPIDALALSIAGGAWRRVERRSVKYPPPSNSRATWARYASQSSLVALAVTEATGEVKVLAHHAVLDCGKALVPEFVSGQLQGGAAMGLGHALFEEMPPYEGGPGEGDWNFARYHVPRASDVAVWRYTAEVLPALADEDIAKGVGEMTLVAPIPAAANAVAHAIGTRIRDLPVTPEKIRKALNQS